MQDLERTQEDKDSKDPYASHQGLQVPSYNPDLSKDKLPLKTSHPYATHSKGEPLTLSLSGTASMGSGGLRKAKSQCYLLFKVFRQTFLDIAIAIEKRQHLNNSYYVQFCGQHLEHGNILPFLSNFLLLVHTCCW